MDRDRDRAWIQIRSTARPIEVDGREGVGCVAVVQMANEKTRGRMGERDAHGHGGAYVCVCVCVYEGYRRSARGPERSESTKDVFMSDRAFIFGTAHIIE